MSHAFTVTISGHLSDRDLQNVSKALHKATAKWFKQGHAISIEAHHE